DGIRCFHVTGVQTCALPISGLLDTAYRNVYNVIIGRYFSVQELGYFERGKAFNTYPVTVLTSIISKVSYPLLSKIQDQKERIARSEERRGGNGMNSSSVWFC